MSKVLPVDASPDDLARAVGGVHVPGASGSFFAIQTESGEPPYLLVSNAHTFVRSEQEAEGAQVEPGETFMSYEVDGRHYALLVKDGQFALAEIINYSTYGLDVPPDSRETADMPRQDVSIMAPLDTEEQYRIFARLMADGLGDGAPSQDAVSFRAKLERLTGEVGLDAAAQAQLQALLANPALVATPQGRAAFDVAFGGFEVDVLPYPGRGRGAENFGDAIIIGQPAREEDRTPDHRAEVVTGSYRTVELDNGAPGVASYRISVQFDGEEVPAIDTDQSETTRASFSGALAVDYDTGRLLGVYRGKFRGEGEVVPIETVLAAMDHAAAIVMGRVEREEVQADIAADSARFGFVTPPVSERTISDDTLAVTAEADVSLR